MSYALACMHDESVPVGSKRRWQLAPHRMKRKPFGQWYVRRRHPREEHDVGPRS